MTVAAKRTITIEVSEAVARQVEAGGETVPEFLERQLRRFDPVARSEASRRWAEENRDWLASYSRYVDEEGTFAERMRDFR